MLCVVFYLLIDVRWFAFEVVVICWRFVVVSCLLVRCGMFGVC